MDKFFKTSPENIYSVTIHYDGECSKERCFNVIKGYSNYKKTIVSHELRANRPHFQVVVILKENETVNSRMPLRKYLQANLPIVSIAISPGRDSRRLRTYVLKEGDWISDGFNTEELKVLEKTTFKKKDWLMEQLDSLEVKYMSHLIDEAEYCAQMEYCRSQCNQTFNENFVKNFVSSKKSKRDGITRKRMSYWKERWEYADF